MADGIQPVNVGTGAGVATEVGRRTCDDEEGEFVEHAVSQDWTVARFMTDYPVFVDARRFNKTFPDGRNKVMFDHRLFRRDTDIGARERRCHAFKNWRPGYISPVGPLDMPSVRNDYGLEYFCNFRQLMAEWLVPDE